MTNFINEDVFLKSAEEILRVCAEQNLIVAYVHQPSEIFEITYHNGGVLTTSYVPRGSVSSFCRQLAVDNPAFGILEVVEIILGVAPEVYATPGAIKLAEELGIEIDNLKHVYVNEHRRASVGDVKAYANSLGG